MSEQQRLRYAELSPGGVGSMRGVEHYLNVESGLDPVLLELVRLRASQMNACEFCLGLHANELRRRHEPESRIEAVARWRDTDAFTQRERAALRWTEVVTGLEEHIPEEAFREVREHFEEKELVDLTVAIASINAWNRLGVAFRPQWDAARAQRKMVAVQAAKVDAAGAVEERPVVGDDGGKVSEDGA